MTATAATIAKLDRIERISDYREDANVTALASMARIGELTREVIFELTGERRPDPRRVRIAWDY